MRLFAALWPPEEAVAELKLEVAAVRGLPGADGLRWAPPDSWHLTLSFYGEADEAQAADLAVRLARAAHRVPEPLWMRLAGAGRFGDRTLWAGLHPDDSDLAALAKLAASTTAAGRRVGLLPPDAPPSFRPHLTLARTRGRGGARRGAGGGDLRRYAEALDGFRGARWCARELLLVRSELPTGGAPGEQPRYLPVERLRLGR